MAALAGTGCMPALARLHAGTGAAAAGLTVAVPRCLPVVALVSVCTDAAGKHQALVKVAGNHQRLNLHHFPPMEAKSIRLQITATNGADTARVFEIRCYA